MTLPTLRRPGRRQTYAVVAIVAAMLAVGHAVHVGSPVFPVDDAYITLHSAEVLYHGADTQYVGTPALTGATSPVHVVVTTLLLPVLPPLWAHWLSSWLGALAYVLALARLAFTLGAGPLEALLVVAAGCVIGETPHQLMNGLETGWAMAGVAWALAAALERPARRRWELPLVLGVLPFLRPELTALSGLLFVNRAWDRFRGRADGASFVRGVAVDAAWVMAGAAPWLLLMTWNTGLPVATTALAKRNYFAEGCLPSATKVVWTEASMVRFADILGVLAFLSPLLLLRRIGGLVLVFGAGFVFAYFTSFPGALGQYEQRYLYILLPALLMAPLFLIDAPNRAVRIAGVALLAVCVVQSARYVPTRWQQHEQYVTFTREELDGVAAWINTHVEPGATVLVHDAGYVGFATRAHIADLVGLKTPAALAPHAELTWPSCGGLRHPAVALIAAREQAHYMIVLDAWQQKFGLTQALTEGGWRLDEQWRGAYRIYRLTPPAAR
jgi:hypothetical protein